MSNIKLLKHYGGLQTIDALIRMFSKGKKKKGDNSNRTQSTARTVRVYL
jgi:hypothetical protein